MQFPLHTFMKAMAVGSAPLAIITQSHWRSSLVVMLLFFVAEMVYVLVTRLRTLPAATFTERVDDISETLGGIMSTMVLGGAIGMLPIYYYCNLVGLDTNVVAAFCAGSSLCLSIGLFFPRLYLVWPRQ